MLQQWMITVGILVSYLVALVVYKSMPDQAATVGWRLILGLGAVPALVGVVLRARMPESPRWLLRQGRYDDVRAAMGKLGVEVSVEDVERTGRRPGFQRATGGAGRVPAPRPDPLPGRVFRTR